MTAAAENKAQRQSKRGSGLVPAEPSVIAKPTSIQLKYLKRGLNEPGGKLPLFDENGQRFKEQTIKACLAKGWCQPWYNNPLKPDWLVCKLTDAGRLVASKN
jgi:hypothetical protein